MILGGKLPGKVGRCRFLFYGPMVKRLRHRPFTAVTRVRFPMESPCGSLAQLGEHLPYKQRVIGSIPIASTITGRKVCNITVRHHSQVVRQRPAKPLPPVRIWVVPPFLCQSPCPSGGMADAKDLKSFGGNSVPVRVRPWAP